MLTFAATGKPGRRRLQEKTPSKSFQHDCGRPTSRAGRAPVWGEHAGKNRAFPEKISPFSEIGQPPKSLEKIKKRRHRELLPRPAEPPGNGLYTDDPRTPAPPPAASPQAHVPADEQCDQPDRSLSLRQPGAPGLRAKSSEEQGRRRAAAAGRLQIRRKEGEPFIITSAHELIQQSPDGKEEVISSHETKQEALDAGDHSEKIKRQTWISRRLDKSLKIEEENRILAQGEEIKAERAAEEQARQEAQAAQEKARAENTEHARRAREPHRVLIGFRTPILNTVPEHDEAKAVYLLMEWKPDDDPAGLPSKIDRLSSREAQEWAKHLTIEGIDVSPYNPVMRLVEDQANW